MRAVALGFDENRVLTVRYYLDREPTDYDYESLSNMVDSIFDFTSSNHDIRSVNEEVIYSTARMADLDGLDGLVYARRERA